MKNLLLIIDPQNDFVDPKGSLYVPGAEKQIKNICKLLKSNIEITDIVISQDSHIPIHCSFSEGWDEKWEIGTQVTEELAKSNPATLVGIRKNGPITIWPKHCIMGDWGYELPIDLEKAIEGWSSRNNKKPYRQYKGGIPWFEAYSLLTEELLLGEDYKRPWRKTNYDQIYITGFCKDICVAETVKDMLNTGEYDGKLIAINNCLGILDPNSKNLEIYKTLKAIEI